MSLIESMSETQIRQLANIATAMTRPVQETLFTDSAVVGPRFAEEFKARLQAHHGTHTTPMDRIAFENAFAAALQAQGHTVELAPSRTTRFWDIRVDGRQTSVKSTAAADLRIDTVHVSKLCEATWIQDVRSAKDRREKTVELFTEFLDAVKAWFVLRIFKQPDGLLYELVEIPTGMFERIMDLPRDAFNSDSPSIDVKDDAGATSFQLALDRSDAKVTIRRIPKSICIVHGQWRLQY